MATQTQYYNLDKPSYDEVADIEIINANMDKIDMQMRNNADGVNFAKGISSDAYDNSKLYAVGDYCIYDNKLYRCITAIESAEAFNVGKWKQTTVCEEIKRLSGGSSDGLIIYEDVIVESRNYAAWDKFDVAITEKEGYTPISCVILQESVDNSKYFEVSCATTYIAIFNARSVSVNTSLTIRVYYLKN